MRLRVASVLSVVSLVGFACTGRFDFDESASGGSAGGFSAGSGGSSSTGGSFGVEDYVKCLAKCEVGQLRCEASSLTCVECNADADCGSRDSERYVCLRELRNRCARCEYNGDCGERSVCVDSAHACSPRCDDPDDSACNGFGPRPSCNLSRGYCEACRNDDDCNSLPATPHCGPARLGCVACASDAHCSEGKLCDPVRNECVACRDSRDCPGKDQVCDPKRHTCTDSVVPIPI